MLAERILDASVLGAALFDEAATLKARQVMRQSYRFVVPDLLFVEMASLTSSKVRRQIITEAIGIRALEVTRQVTSDVVPAADHYQRAFQLAVAHDVSAYDGLYLAVAEARGAPLVTADDRLVRKARSAGLNHLVEPL